MFHEEVNIYHDHYGFFIKDLQLQKCCSPLQNKDLSIIYYGFFPYIDTHKKIGINFDLIELFAWKLKFRPNYVMGSAMGHYNPIKNTSTGNIKAVSKSDKR